MDNDKIINLNKKFGYVVAGALIFIAAVQFVFKHKHNFVIVVIAGLLLLFTAVKPLWLTPLRVVWDKIGHVLAIINTYILLILFYCLILSPLGLLMRLFGKDILKLKHAPNQLSYWEPAPEIEDSKMENQF